MPPTSAKWDRSDHRNALRFVHGPLRDATPTFQLAIRLPDYRKLVMTLPEIAELDRKDAAELFDYLLANPLRSVIYVGRERYLIVIDALDEAGEAGRNPLVEMLARNVQRISDWLGLVVTSRPEQVRSPPLQGLNPSVLDTATESGRGSPAETRFSRLRRLDSAPTLKSSLPSQMAHFEIEMASRQAERETV